ncbi:dTDP-glucose 4,6-dehydratase [Lutibacter sp.]|uniref:dTDP-glucose 4,6-dehydratase n=1 Tax=Lutibacter sp. TaxID=1925666 RepID=UPI00356AFC27
MNKTISILGCGWLGLPTAIKLIENGYHVKGSTTSPEKIATFKNLNIEPYIISIENLKDSNISSFLTSQILLIALPSKNIEGFKNLLKLILTSTIKKVVFISSTSVYTAKNKIVTETSILKPSALLEIENLFKTPKLKTTIVRFAGLFGYNRKPGNFFRNGRIIPNPNGFVNMIHQDDCVNILFEIISKEIYNETFNACADSHPNRTEYYTKVKKDIGVEPPVFEKTDSSPFKIVCNKKIKETLNYTFKYPDLLKINYSAPFL